MLKESHYPEYYRQLAGGKRERGNYGTHNSIQIPLATPEFHEMGKYNPSLEREVEFGEQETVCQRLGTLFY